MKTSAIVCAVLAGSFGLSSVAQAQSWRDRDHDRGQRVEQHQDRRDNRWDGQRDNRWDGRRDNRWDGHRDNRWDGRRDNAWRQPEIRYQQPRYVYQQQPHYVYQQPSYRQAHRFYRGAYLPYEYRNRGYYVNNWNAYPGLYQPAYGQQWVNVDGQFLLVALATGLIANALMQ